MFAEKTAEGGIIDETPIPAIEPHIPAICIEKTTWEAEVSDSGFSDDALKNSNSAYKVESSVCAHEGWGS